MFVAMNIVANCSSDVPTLVLPSLPLPSPTRPSLLSQPVVVARHSLVPRHDHCLHIRRAGILQHWLPNAADEQH